jgi:hypothetical protein
VSAADPYANELEQAFGSLPGWLQDPLRPIFNVMNECLQAVAGEPHELVAAGDSYAQLGERVRQLADQQRADRGALAGHWSGEGYDAFSAKMAEVEDQLRQVGDLVGKTKEILQAGAEACVEAANAIIEIIVGLLMIWLADLLIDAVLSAFTFGAAMLATIVQFIAEGLEALAQIASVVERTAQILMKLAKLFREIMELLDKVVVLLRRLREALKAMKALQKAAKGWDKAGTFALRAGTKAAVTHGISAATGGYVDIPGVGGKMWEATKDLYHAGQDANRAGDEADS